jgi:hypothetical protein
VVLAEKLPRFALPGLGFAEGMGLQIIKFAPDITGRDRVDDFRFPGMGVGRLTRTCAATFAQAKSCAQWRLRRSINGVYRLEGAYEKWKQLSAMLGRNRFKICCKRQELGDSDLANTST